MRKIIAFLSGIKGKLEHFHSRISGILHKLYHAFCQISQILCDDRSLSHSFLHCREQLQSGTLSPFSKFCCFISKRNGIILIKSPKMVYSHYIIKLIAMFQSPYPPDKSCFFVIFPVIKWVSPKLAGSRKRIRRAAGYCCRRTLLIKLEKLRSSPGIRAVKSYINRNIADNTDSLIVGIFFQFRPLFCELILLKTDKLDLLCQFLLLLFHGLGHSSFQISRPLAPADASQTVLNSHIKGVIFQPVLIFLCECFKPFIRHKPLEGLPEDLKSGKINLFIINKFCIIPKVTGVTFFSGEKLLFDQRLQVDKIWIPGKGGKGLIGRIPISCRSQRKDLPVLLSSCF